MATSDLLDRLPRQLRMRELRVFVSVLDHRSFRKAASALNVTQPAVTKSVTSLEELLGVKLFDRLAHGVEPTIHGLSLAPHARAVFGELRSAAQNIALVSRGDSGTLKVGTVPMPAASFLPVAAGRMLERHPDILLSLVEARDAELVGLLRDRMLDLAIVRVAQFPTAADLAVDELFQETLCVLAARRHPLASRLHVTWEELLDELWVLPTADSLFLRNVRRALDKVDLPMPRNTIESASIHVQYSMVQHGSMLSFGTRSDVAVSPVSDSLVRLPVALPRLTGSIGIVTLRTHEQRPLAVRFVEELRAIVAAAD